MIRFAASVMLLALAVDSAASPRIDLQNCSWQDYFSDLTGLSRNKQGAWFSPGGFTVNPDPVYWSQPWYETGDYERFSAPSSPGMQVDPTVTVSFPGTNQEEVTLWSRIYIPSAALTEYRPSGIYTAMASCEVGGGNCGGVPLRDKNGVIYSREITNFPYFFKDNIIPEVLWGCDDYGCTDTEGKLSHSIDAFYNSPILYGANERLLVAGYPYAVSFFTALNATRTSVDYLEFRVVELMGNTVHASAVLKENAYLYDTIGGSFVAKTPVTIVVDPLPDVSGALWDFQVISKVQPDQGHNHPTTIGPVIATGARGSYESPTLDSLSPQTEWLALSWDCYVGTKFVDAGSAVPAESPICPVQIAYEAQSPSSTRMFVPPAAPSPDGKIDATISQSSSTPLHDGTGGKLIGRYFKYWLNLFSRATAAELDVDLAPLPLTYWGSYRPQVRRMTVRYKAAAAQAVSACIAPPSIKKWGFVRYGVYTPGASSVQVDVLDENGALLIQDVASGDSLASIDPYTYSRIKLRATLSNDPGDTSIRPVLESWEATWEPLPEIVEVRCNSIRPDRGESCAIQIGVPEAGKVRAAVYDVAGQEIKTLVDGEMAPQALMVTWDGRNESGRIVASGVYFLNVSVPGAKKVKRLAVVR